MQKTLDRAAQEIGTVLLGKDRQVRLALCCLITGGHLLLEDLPGMGKTTLSHALAKVLGLEYRRVQFTSDLLPGDILGASIFDRPSNKFQFLPGPIFTQVLLADEINRSTPKTQSALLEAMAERQVTIEGETRALPQPFFVIATQNPLTQAGTYPLPESQLDRFLMRLSLGYPDPAAERLLLTGEDAQARLAHLQQCVSLEQLQKIHSAVDRVHTSEQLLDYVQRLIAYTRNEPGFAFGLSPRGALALLRSAKAWALMNGRGHAVPEDVQIVLPAVVEHRLHANLDLFETGKGGDGGSLVDKLLRRVAVV
ncbi:MAG TPA: MoxR family ATPase [Spongiibacteraceae bacterium]|nr:MoxR family ATPase [Spongiibacteraceae bacterium]